MSKVIQVDLGRDSYNIVIGDDFVSSIKAKINQSNSICILITQFTLLMKKRAQNQ